MIYIQLIVSGVFRSTMIGLSEPVCAVRVTVGHTVRGVHKIGLKATIGTQ